VKTKTLRASDAEKWLRREGWLASANQMLFTFVLTWMAPTLARHTSKRKIRNSRY